MTNSAANNAADAKRGIRTTELVLCAERCRSLTKPSSKVTRIVSGSCPIASAYCCARPTALPVRSAPPRLQPLAASAEQTRARLAPTLKSSALRVAGLGLTCCADKYARIDCNAAHYAVSSSSAIADRFFLTDSPATESVSVCKHPRHCHRYDDSTAVRRHRWEQSGLHLPRFVTAYETPTFYIVDYC